MCDSIFYSLKPAGYLKAMKMIPAFYFDHDHLQQLAEKHHEEFLNAQPFRHVVIDNLIPDDMARLLVEEFPEPDAIEWERGTEGAMRSNVRNFQKLGHSNETDFGPFTRHLILQFYSQTFIRFLGALTGQWGLIMDPQYRGGGLHSTGPGGKLMVHADKSRHPNKKVDQILNLLFYLNPDWKEEYGGHLELWDKDLKECKQRILPVMNRLVLFKSGTNSFHGHPQPLACPEGRRRNSIAIYYYLFERPRDESYEGFRNYVDWVPTTEEERALPLEETRPQLFRFEKKKNQEEQGKEPDT
jgi:Rps23 Pro-64 3,4-dihydroxylase Tpa1-like proline 4-hydroxylase